MADRFPQRPLYYESLKVSQDAPVEVIRAAYRTLSLKYHPDRNGADECAHVMAALNEAYEVLSHPVKKREYDSWIRQDSLKTKGENGREDGQKPALAHPRRLRRLTAGRIAGALSVLGCCAALAYYLASQNKDPWLERAWHESWRSDVSGESGEQSTLLRSGRAGAAAEPAGALTPALRWEDGLKNSAVTDVRF